MFQYETHLHTFPVSRCARASVQENLEFYKKAGYDGVFITNHFLDGNINFDRTRPYEEGIRFYFSDYEEGVRIGKALDMKVFCGVEISYKGTDFLIYGLDKQWFLDHPEIMTLKLREKLDLMAESGAAVIQAHPFREASYIDHVRLFPRNVHGVEMINACCTEFENKMARIYAENYGLIPFAGSDNHAAGKRPLLAGVCCQEPVSDEWDFINKIKAGKMELFTLANEET